MAPLRYAAPDSARPRRRRRSTAARSSIVPPSSSTRRRAIESPRPDPGAFDARQKRSKARSRWSARQAGAFVDHVQLAGLRGDRDRRAGRRGVERVREQVVEHLLDPPLAGADHAAVAPSLEPHAALLAERRPELDAPLDDVAEPQIARQVAGGVGARKLEQLVDEPGEPLGLDERCVGLAVLEPEPQRRQRRPQLVRRVGDELLLRREQRRELGGRAIELPRETAHVGRAVGLARARGQLAAADARGDVLEAAERLRDRTGEQQPDERRDGRGRSARPRRAPGGSG